MRCGVLAVAAGTCPAAQAADLPVLIDGPALSYRSATTGLLHLEGPALSYRAATDGPLTLEGPMLSYRGTATGILTIDGPALTFRATTGGPLKIEGPALSYRAVTEGPMVIEGPPLSYRASVEAWLTIEGPAMSYRASSDGPVTIDGPLLSYRAADATPSATPGLEILDVPTGPRESRYLTLDNASVEYDQGLTLRYRGLPESNGYGALFYMGQQPPRLAAWFYTLKSKPEGEWVRSSLPSYTGDWKACIGFPPQVTTNSPDLDRYEDCLDFVVAGPGSIGARPTLELPPDGIRAGKDAVIRYGGMPPANCEVGIYSASGTLVTRHFTNRAASGTWTLRLAQPGSYELRIKYLGDAVRARMPLEVSP